MNGAGRNILVIGAGGFVGPWLIRALIAGGWSVTGVSRRAICSHDPNYTHVIADSTNISSCLPYIDKAEAVIYNAAYIPTNYGDPKETEACLRVNALAPLAILGSLVARPRPFVYISGAQGYQAEGRLATEDDLFFPSGHATYYLSSKFLGDIYTEHYRVANSVPTTTLRVGSVYGPGQQRGMIAHFVQQARSGNPIYLKNGGLHQVDLTFVGDVGAAVSAVLQHRALGIFNIGAGYATTALEAAQLVLAAAGRSADLLKIEPMTGTNSTYGFAALDVSKSKREFGYAPTLPSIGLRRTVHEWL